jgi:peptide/nickel transport system substrate-binding protein
MFIWFWTQDSDPSFMLAVPTEDNIEGWNDTLWWSPETDELFNDQDQALDVDQRIAAAQEMQRLVYQAANYLIFAYPYQMEAYNSDKWEGVVPSPSDIEGYDGSAFYNYQNIDTYKSVTKKTATAADGGANTTVLLIVGIVAAVVVVGVIVMLVRRRAARSEVE